MKRLKNIALLLGAVAASGWTPAQASVVTDWNAITLVCVQGQAGPPVIPANRLGPTGNLDVALVHAAVHDAVQANHGRFEPYHYENSALRGVGSPEAAAAAAAYGVLVGLYGADDPCLAAVTNPAITYAGDHGLQAETKRLQPFCRSFARHSHCRTTPSPVAPRRASGVRRRRRLHRPRSGSSR